MTWKADAIRLRNWFLGYLALWVIGVIALFSSSSEDLTPGIYIWLLCILPYIGCIVYAYRVQDKLHKAGLYGHGAWHVIVGAILFNPLIVGLLIPASVLWTAHRVSSKIGKAQLQSPAVERTYTNRAQSTSPTSTPSHPLSPRNIAVLLVAIAVVGAIAYYQIAPKSPSTQCPTSVRAEPLASASAIQWSSNGKKPALTANIVRVAAECIQIHSPAITAGGNNIPASISYQFPATASINYDITDSAWFSRATAYTDFKPTVVFEAVSPADVVLVSEESQFKVVDGGRNGTTSATLVVSNDVVSRVALVRARWAYGRQYP